MIAYLGNWHDCPSDEQIAEYTHIVIAFAVSYTWTEEKNICDPTCQISKPLTCDDREDQDLIERWQAMGKKVILSFGGAGMGGSWEGDNNNCWDYCFGNEDYVVERLTDLVTEMGLDGIDIDYEYFYEDGQNGSDFNKGAEAQKFLKDVSLGLRDAMPNTELTHAPMDPDVVPGTGYFNVLEEIADSLDFLMPQYYNGNVHSHSDFGGALDHYDVLVDTVFKGDPTKVVFGFCIGECDGYNLDGNAAKEVMGWLAESYPCNGGAFFWVVNDDTNGSWSSKVNEQLAIDTDACSAIAPTSAPTGSLTIAPTGSPTSAPTKAPTSSPTESPTSSPTRAPTRAPTSTETGSPTSTPTRSPTLAEEVSLIIEPVCANDQSFGYGGNDKKNCDWILKKTNMGSDICEKKSQGIHVDEACPLACGTCCGDDEFFRFDGEEDKDCGWVREEHLSGSNICKEKYKTKILVKDSCRLACQTCCVDDETFRWKDNDEKDCNWVQQQHENGKNICQKRDPVGIKVKKFCPVACEACE